MKKCFKFIILLLLMLVLVACGNKNENLEEVYDITITIFDKENNCVYNEEKITNEEYLFDALESFDDLVIEAEDGEYGKYITSINELKQEDNYYWNYYINNRYADVGVANCKIEDDNVYTFKLEKFE